MLDTCECEHGTILLSRTNLSRTGHLTLHSFYLSSIVLIDWHWPVTGASKNVPSTSSKIFLWDTF